MQIVYTCPKCGGDLEELVLTSFPPQYQKRCKNCNWKTIEKSDDIVVRIPYKERILQGYKAESEDKG